METNQKKNFFDADPDTPTFWGDLPSGDLASSGADLKSALASLKDPIPPPKPPEQHQPAPAPPAPDVVQEWEESLPWEQKTGPLPAMTDWNEADPSWDTDSIDSDLDGSWSPLEEEEEEREEKTIVAPDAYLTFQSRAHFQGPPQPPPPTPAPLERVVPPEEEKTRSLASPAPPLEEKPLETARINKLEADALFDAGMLKSADSLNDLETVTFEESLDEVLNQQEQTVTFDSMDEAANHHDETVVTFDESLQEAGQDETVTFEGSMDEILERQDPDSTLVQERFEPSFGEQLEQQLGAASPASAPAPAPALPGAPGLEVFIDRSLSVLAQKLVDLAQTIEGLRAELKSITSKMPHG